MTVAPLDYKLHEGEENVLDLQHLLLFGKYVGTPWMVRCTPLWFVLGIWIFTYQIWSEKEVPFYSEAPKEDRQKKMLISLKGSGTTCPIRSS